MPPIERMTYFATRIQARARDPLSTYVSPDRLWHREASVTESDLFGLGSDGGELSYHAESPSTRWSKGFLSRIAESMRPGSTREALLAALRQLVKDGCTWD